MAIATTAIKGWVQPSSKLLLMALAVGGVVFAASLFGILTRPVGFLAAFWPANAILLGLMVRNPAMASLWGWLSAFVGYLAADLSTGGELDITLWLTIANMVGAITGYLLYRLLPESDRRLSRPLSVLYLFAICCAASAVAAVTGGGIAQALFGRDFRTGFEFWFVSELVNSLTILPVILTFPDSRRAILAVFPAIKPSILSFWHAVPLLSLIAAALCSVYMGGPGAIAFPVPALLWCALTYRIFTTAFLTMCFCACLLVAIPAGIVQIPSPTDTFAHTSSIRLGIALMSLGPLTVASVNAARSELLAKVTYAADHDNLTRALSRTAFMDRAKRCVADCNSESLTVALLMLDIDHFKQVNDSLGHVVGDMVLRAFARSVADALRQKDILGRTGGDEFAVVLPGTSADEAIAAAERVRTSVARSSITQNEQGVPITVSIGVAVSSQHSGADFKTLVAIADQALYRAKARGRNQVEAG